jgi:hypothetical protein
MTKQKETLLQVIRENFDQTILRICNRLQKISPSHYEIIDFERHQEREEEFLKQICDGIERENDELLKSNMVQLANIRNNEGYTLAEVQKAFDAVEEELWYTLTHCGRDNGEIIELLHELHQVMTLMRNQFAVSYADKQIDVQKRMAKLKERFFIYRHDRKDLEAKNDESD